MKIFYGISIFDKDKDLKGKEVAFEIEESAQVSFYNSVPRQLVKEQIATFQEEC